MRRYLDNGLLIDILLCTCLGIVLSLLKSYLEPIIIMPERTDASKVLDSIIKLGATLIGFLLTIISFIITFRNTQLTQTKPAPTQKDKSNDPPTESIFDKKISPREVFYVSDIHKNVIRVFFGSVYEMGIVVFVFLGLQFNIFKPSDYFYILIVLLGFISMFLSVFRSFTIYRHFIKVHLQK